MPRSKANNAAARKSLSKEDLLKFQATLQDWHTVEDFSELTESIRNQLDGNEFSNWAEAKFLREAYLLAAFAQHTAANAIRLVLPKESEWPDGQIKVQSNVLNVEIAECIMPGRKRGAEFRPGMPKMQEDPVEKWVERGNAIPNALRQTIQKKTKKHYADRVHLVVYLNIDEWGIMQNETIAAISALKAEFASPFLGLHVKWKNVFY